jgi:hypothetical protein
MQLSGGFDDAPLVNHGLEHLKIDEVHGVYSHLENDMFSIIHYYRISGGLILAP